MLRSNKQGTSWRRGQGLVELALVLPVLVFTLMAIAEIGWYMRSYIVVGTAAREGARFGARGPHRITDPLLAAQQIIDQTSASLADLISVDFIGADSNVRVMVTLVNINKDGSWMILPAAGPPPSLTSGEFSASTTVCTVHPCAAGAFDLPAVALANHSFGSVAALCPSGEECSNDLVILEIVYGHRPLVFQLDFMPETLPVASRVVMRIVTAR